MIYLACPYDKVENKNEVFKTVNRVAAFFFSKGEQVFSPISHSHLLNKMTKKVDWLSFDLKILAICDVVYVLCIEGYLKSNGIRIELKAALKTGKPIRYIDTKCQFL